MLKTWLVNKTCTMFSKNPHDIGINQNCYSMPQEKFYRQLSALRLFGAGLNPLPPSQICSQTAHATCS